MQAFICMSIREDPGLQERQTNNIIVYVMPILTIVQQADTVSPFAQINPAMSAGLKTGYIPGGVTMRRTLNAAKLNFMGRSCAVDCQRKGSFQQRLVFVPVDFCSKVDARRSAPERKALGDTRGHVRTDNFDGCTHWPLFENAQRCDSSHRVRFLFIKEINIPGVKIQGTILVSDKLVACLPGGKNVALDALVVEPADLSLRVDPELIILILQDDGLFISVGSASSGQYLRLTAPRIGSCWYDLHPAGGKAHTIQQEHCIPLPVARLLVMRKRWRQRSLHLYGVRAFPRQGI